MNKMLTSLSTIIERWNEPCLNQESSGQVRFINSSGQVRFKNSFENYFDPDRLQIRYGYNKCINRPLISRSVMSLANKGCKKKKKKKKKKLYFQIYRPIK